jgi:hypothetical protein
MTTGPASNIAAAHLRIIWVRVAQRGARWEVSRTSDLPDPDLNDIMNEAVGAQSLKDMPRIIERVRKARGLPGLLVALNVSDAGPLSAPLAYPFEALPVGNGRGDEACQLLVTGQESLSQMQEARVCAISRKRRRSRRLALLIMAMNALVVWSSSTRYGAPAWLVLAFLALLISIRFVPHLLERSWYLVPQGMFVQRSWLPWAEGDEVVPAGDCTLMMIASQHGWNVALARGARVLWNQFSPLELAATIAAWSSSVPPPTLDQVQNLA